MKNNPIRLILLYTLLLLTMFSCSNGKSTAVANYSTDYINSKPTSKLFIHPYERTGNIAKCIEQAILIADIKILGLSNTYHDSTLPFSVYIGKVIEFYKNETESTEYIYIARYGSPDTVVSDLNIFKPGDEIILFLKEFDNSIKCSEQPIYCGCYDGFFENLYVCEEDGIKYILPDTLDDFFPSKIITVDKSISSEIIRNVHVNTRQKTVYYFNDIKEYILTEVHK